MKKDFLDIFDQFTNFKEKHEEESEISLLDEKMNSLLLELNKSQRCLENLIKDTNEYEEKVADWCEFLDQARTELSACNDSLNRIWKRHTTERLC